MYICYWFKCNILFFVQETTLKRQKMKEADSPFCYFYEDSIYVYHRKSFK